jgi:hypothetical protein
MVMWMPNVEVCNIMRAHLKKYGPKKRKTKKAKKQLEQIWPWQPFGRTNDFVSLIRVDLKFPGDSRKAPKPNRVVGSLIPNCEIISLLDGKLAR